jgi:hypothetical protein
MNTYEYKVIGLTRDSDDVINSVDFSITAGDGVDSFTHQYNTALRKGEEIIPFSQVTEADVIAWVKSLVGARCEEQADAELAAYKERTTIKSGVPWE